MGGLSSAKLRATLIRLALAETQVIRLLPAGEGWREQIAQAELAPEDGWALAHAARLLARHPDPGWWAKLATEARSG
jgi:hypothetical protein